MGQVKIAGGFSTSSFPSRLRYLFLVAAVCGSIFILFSASRNLSVYFTSEDFRILQNTVDRNGFTIKTEGCSIPKLIALDDNIKKFVFYPKNMKPCRDPNIALLTNNKTRIWIRKENFNHYNISNVTNVNCCYRGFFRPVAIDNIMASSVDDRVKYQDCIYFNDSIKVKDEFVRVSCVVNTTTVYEQFYLFAPKKSFLMHDGKGESLKSVNSYNVIVLGIDAVSRLNLHRTMPKTIAYIMANDGIELIGYNKVGDNTFPNLIPMLLGIKDTELKKTCLPHNGATFDNCPFVWEWFKQAGYYTALAEDSSWLGTFNYVKVGFSNTPTDYYIHTFINEAEHNVGYNKDFNSFLCMNDKPFYKVLLDYAENLTNTLKNTRLFGFFWEVTMSHDHLNYPRVMDEVYLSFFKRLNTTRYLSETIIILASDHGIRWGDIRSTKQGRLEERLPFIFILTPPSFRENYSEAYSNLKSNSKRLTTPFDVHESLMDLIDLKKIEDKTIKIRSSEPYAQNRGISLFLQIPQNRTCEMAGIDDHWCTCHKSTILSKTDPKAMEVGTQLVKQLNLLMREHPECAQLTLAEILDVTEMEAGNPEKNEAGWKEYMVVVTTTPGDGVFEATLRRDGQEWALAGTASRLNLYGDQSHCVHDYQLKLYCYCV